MAKRTRKNLDNLFEEGDSQADGYFQSEARPVRVRAARVVEVPLSQCLPDRFQSRIILPLPIKNAFFFGDMDCYAAAAAFLEAAGQDAGMQIQVESLLELGDNILEVGQIEPATGSWLQGEGGRPIFAIEVGERRFWSLALAAMVHQLPDEPVLRVIEEAQFSRQRQISENVHREGNTAVDRARAIAGLILLQLGKLPDPNVDDDLDYFRQVLQIKRLKNNTWPELERQMRISRPVMERHLQILRLPSKLIYLAKLYDVPEGRLREVLAAPPDMRDRLMRMAIEEDMTARELRLEVEKKAPPRPPQRRPAASIHARAANRLRSLLRLIRQHDFGGGYQSVAVEYSATTEDAEELIEAAEHLEAQAGWLREMYKRRQ